MQVLKDNINLVHFSNYDRLHFNAFIFATEQNVSNQCYKKFQKKYFKKNILPK